MSSSKTNEQANSVIDFERLKQATDLYRQDSVRLKVALEQINAASINYFDLIVDNGGSEEIASEITKKLKEAQALINQAKSMAFKAVVDSFQNQNKEK